MGVGVCVLGRGWMEIYSMRQVVSEFVSVGVWCGGEVVHTEAADLFACRLNKGLSSSNPVLPQRVEKH